MPLEPFTLIATNPSTGSQLGAVAGAFEQGASAATRDLILSDTGVLNGLVRRHNGQAVTSGTVFASGPAFRSMTLSATGSFLISGLPSGAYQLTASVPHPQGSALTGTQSVQVIAGQQSTATITLESTGRVSGVVRQPGGAPAASVTVSLAFGTRSYSTVTDTSGRFSFVDVPVGQFVALAADSQNQFQGETSSSLSEDGQEVTVDIQLLSSAVNLPLYRYDANGFYFDIQHDGSVANGVNSVYAGTNEGGFGLDVVSAGTATHFTGASVGSSEDAQQEIAIRQTGLAGLEVTRKVFAPVDGYFVRYLEILRNPGTAPSPSTCACETMSEPSSDSSGSSPRPVVMPLWTFRVQAILIDGLSSTTRLTAIRTCNSLVRRRRSCSTARTRLLVPPQQPSQIRSPVQTPSRSSGKTSSFRLAARLRSCTSACSRPVRPAHAHRLSASCNCLPRRWPD